MHQPLDPRHGGQPRWHRYALVTILSVAPSCGGPPPIGTDAGTRPANETTAPQPQAAPQQPTRPAAGFAWIIFGADTVTAEVASRPEQREQGLMDRDAVPPGTGMLFVFADSEQRSFWMRDTYVPLDIAFFDDDHRIAGIKPMEPEDETLVDSDVATALVLEVPRGWFAEKGIRIGDQATVVFGPGLEIR